MSTDSRSVVTGRTLEIGHQQKISSFHIDDYSGHFCFGIIYTRADAKDPEQHAVTTVENLCSIASVIKDFQFFVCEKWQLASDRQGSGNTANIGSITAIDDIVKGNGVFAKLGEDWFDEYWMNYGVTKMKKGRKTVPIKRLEDFVAFKGGNKDMIVPIKRKRKEAKT